MQPSKNAKRDSAIFKDYNSGTSRADIAKKYNLSQSRIRQIVVTTRRKVFNVIKRLYPPEMQEEFAKLIYLK